MLLLFLSAISPFPLHKKFDQILSSQHLENKWVSSQTFLIASGNEVTRVTGRNGAQLL